MPQTPLGLTYPDSGDHTRLWEHFQTLAEDVDTLLHARMAIQKGEETWDLDGAGTGSWNHSATVDFAVPFLAPPQITVQRTNGFQAAGVATVSETQFRLWGWDSRTAGYVGFRVKWWAFGFVAADAPIPTIPT